MNKGRFEKMGLFDIFFPNKTSDKVKYGSTLQMLNGYTPKFYTWDGRLYENELVRSAIDARSRHISKLSVEFVGTANPTLRNKLKRQPNAFQTWGQFLYRVNTILDMQNTCFIVPTFDKYFEHITGLVTFLPKDYSIVEHKGELFIRFEFNNGEIAASKLKEVGILTKYQYESEFFGENNQALNDTMQLINIQQQGITEAVKNGATYRFIAQMNNFAKDSDLAKERKRFTDSQLTADGGGILLFPNTYTNIKQVESRPYAIDTTQMKVIQDNVFRYFGCNEAIMNNSAKGDEMDAFFNGAIEPFSIQLSDVLTKMLFTDNEQERGTKVYVTANRLQYMTTSEKVSMAQQLGDRGAITINEIRELFNYAPIDGGDKNPIRGEYYFVQDGKKENDNASEE